MIDRRALKLRSKPRHRNRGIVLELEVGDIRLIAAVLAEHESCGQKSSVAGEQTMDSIVKVPGRLTREIGGDAFTARPERSPFALKTAFHSVLLRSIPSRQSGPLGATTLSSQKMMHKQLGQVKGQNAQRCATATFAENRSKRSFFFFLSFFLSFLLFFFLEDIRTTRWR